MHNTHNTHQQYLLYVRVLFESLYIACFLSIQIQQQLRKPCYIEHGFASNIEKIPKATASIKPNSNTASVSILGSFRLKDHKKYWKYSSIISSPTNIPIQRNPDPLNSLPSTSGSNIPRPQDPAPTPRSPAAQAPADLPEVFAVLKKDKLFTDRFNQLKQYNRENGHHQVSKSHNQKLFNWMCIFPKFEW